MSKSTKTRKGVEGIAPETLGLVRRAAAAEGVTLDQWLLDRVKEERTAIEARITRLNEMSARLAPHIELHAKEGRG